MAEIAFHVAGTILYKLGSPAFSEISSAWGLKDDLTKLQRTTSILKAVLKDAENKQPQNAELRIWLVQLKNVLDDIMEVLDEFDCESLRRQVVKEYGSLGRKVRRFFLRSNRLVFRFSIAHQIKEVRQRLDEIHREMEKFKLISDKIGGQEVIESGVGREMTHSFVNPSDVIGRDKDRSNIIGMLLNQNKISDDNLCVIPIVGLGGLGKATLAKFVYNDEKVVERFDLRMWVCVRFDLNVTETIREILKSAISSTKSSDQSSSIRQSMKDTNSVSNLSIDQLQVFLRSILKDKTFSLVLDDVWSHDHFKWVELRDVLGVGSKDSKVLVTTRNFNVAWTMSRTLPYELQLLSEDDSLSLFLKYAFGDEKRADEHPRLKTIGHEIVKKCGGLPLAARALGSLLQATTDEDKWTFVRDHQIWELERDRPASMLSALELSYITMPSHLKQCFVICSLFSKHVGNMSSFHLICFWMALGIVQVKGERVEMEDIGNSYFQELCTRSFFQYLGDAEETFWIYQEFEMHNLILDLAHSIFHNVELMIDGSTKNIPDGVKYVTISFNEGDDTTRLLSILHKSKKVQTLHLKTNEKPFVVETLVSTCISRFTNLRILLLRESSLEVLPCSIGALKHLRYLDLSDNKILKNLPDSICKLQNLQTLWLIGCEKLEELPRNIKNLVSLRTLSVTKKQTHFAENGIGRLRSLQFLFLEDCRNLESLPQDFKCCRTLRTLLICGCEKLDLAKGSDEVVQLNLQRLFIIQLPQTTRIPQWLQGASQTLKYLIIGGCPKLTTFPEWLPNLTSLQQLRISDCPSLTSLPDGMQRLNSLTKLVVEFCDELEERCKRQIGEDWPKIAHIPYIQIGDEQYIRDES